MDIWGHLPAPTFIMNVIHPKGSGQVANEPSDQLAFEKLHIGPLQALKHTQHLLLGKACSVAEIGKGFMNK